MFVDFAELKSRVSIEEAVQMLGLVMKSGNNQFRGPCPACKGGGERALVITSSKAAFYCFAAHKGGDVIALVAHIRNCDMKVAAQFLAEQIRVEQQQPKRTVPESGAREEGTKTLAALSYLEPEHDAVHAVGFSSDFCKKHGIGYAPRGIMRGTVAIPFRDEHGTLLGYIGVTECTLPADFTPNVVPFGKKSA